MFSVHEPKTVPPSGVLTFTHHGIPDIQILQDHYAALDAAYRRGVKDGRTSSKDT